MVHSGHNGSRLVAQFVVCLGVMDCIGVSCKQRLALPVLVGVVTMIG